MITTRWIGDTLIVSLVGEHHGTVELPWMSSYQLATDLVNFLSALWDAGILNRERKTTSHDQLSCTQSTPTVFSRREPGIDDETIATHCRFFIIFEDLLFRLNDSRLQLVAFDTWSSCWRCT